MTHTPEWQQTRIDAVQVILDRLSEISMALLSALHDPLCKDLRRFTNSQGVLVVGCERELADLMAQHDQPLARKQCDEAAFVAATDKYFA